MPRKNTGAGSKTFTRHSNKKRTCFLFRSLLLLLVLFLLLLLLLLFLLLEAFEQEYILVAVVLESLESTGHIGVRQGTSLSSSSLWSLSPSNQKETLAFIKEPPCPPPPFGRLVPGIKKKYWFSLTNLLVLLLLLVLEALGPKGNIGCQ